MRYGRHPFDLAPETDTPLDLFVEELPDQVLYVSDCLSTASSLSTKGCLGSFSTVGSVISCGDDDDDKDERARSG